MSAFHHKDQLTLDNIFDELMDDVNQEEPDQKIRFIKHKRKSYPVQLTADFRKFVEMVQHTPVGSYISNSQLTAIHEKMSIKECNETEQAIQQRYPYIHFFCHIAVSGKLIEIQRVQSGKLKFKTTERWGLYRDLTDTEQYLFLLETFWVDADWAKLLEKDFNPVHHLLPEVFSKITDAKSKSQLDFTEKEVLLGQLISGWNHFFLYMEWFGFWVCDKDATGHYMQRLTATPFGMKMIPVLLKYRDIKLWNIPLRKEFGEVRPVSGSKIPDMETPGNADYQPFYKAFTTLFPIHELQDTLPRYFYSEG